MFFTEDDDLRELEFLMRGVPKFKPRGHGVVVVCGLKYEPLIESRKQLILWATQNIKHPAFRIRLNSYLLERGEFVMDYINKNHQETFEENIKKVDQNNKSILAAIYLLTADVGLQRLSRKCIKDNNIAFGKINTNLLKEKGYTLMCAAKDLYLGTKYMSISDLSDELLISSDVFGLICNAIGIKRFGLKVLSKGEIKL